MRAIGATEAHKNEKKHSAGSWRSTRTPGWCAQASAKCGSRAHQPTASAGRSGVVQTQKRAQRGLGIRPIGFPSERPAGFLAQAHAPPSERPTQDSGSFGARVQRNTWPLPSVAARSMSLRVRPEKRPRSISAIVSPGAARPFLFRAGRAARPVFTRCASWTAPAGA
jgi:hypothetical protein